MSEMIATRDGYGKALVELGKENDKIVIVSADLEDSTRSKWFAKEFPDRAFTVGIAEQDMVGTAAGLALGGYTVFVNSFAVFMTNRAYDGNAGSAPSGTMGPSKRRRSPLSGRPAAPVFSHPISPRPTPRPAGAMELKRSMNTGSALASSPLHLAHGLSLAVLRQVCGGTKCSTLTIGF